MYVCIYIYICVCVIYDMNRTHIHINRYAYVRTQTHRHRHIMTHIFMYQCIYDDICIYIYTHMYLNLFTYLHMTCVGVCTAIIASLRRFAGVLSQVWMKMPCGTPSAWNSSHRMAAWSLVWMVAVYSRHGCQL